MADWYSRAREEDGRTDDEVAAEIRLRRDATTGDLRRERDALLVLIARGRYSAMGPAEAAIAALDDLVAAMEEV